jgi:hypothetical protein
MAVKTKNTKFNAFQTAFPVTNRKNFEANAQLLDSLPLWIIH